MQRNHRKADAKKPNGKYHDPASVELWIKVRAHFTNGKCTTIEVGSPGIDIESIRPMPVDRPPRRHEESIRPMPMDGKPPKGREGDQ